MKRLNLLLMLFSTVHILGQVPNVDSLVNVLNTQKHTPEEKIKLYMDITKSYLFNDPETSIKYAKEGVIVAEKEKDYSATTQFNEFMGLGYHYRWDDSVDVSINHFNKALEFAAKCENKDLREARIYINMGVVYSGHDDQRSALECYLKALPHAEAIGNKGFQAMILCNIGAAHRTLRNTTQAKEYLERGLKIAEENDFKDSKATGYYNLGDIYRYNEEYDIAEKYLLRAYELTMESNDIYLRSVILSCLTLVYANTSQFEKSLERANESVELAKEGGNASYIAATYRTLSDAYYRMKLYKECEEAALEGWAADSTNLDQSQALAFNIGLANIFLGNKSKAAHYFWRHSELMNEHIDKSFRQEIVDNEVKYETEKKELQIASLEKEKGLYTWLGIAGLLFATALGTALWQNIRNTKKEKQLIASRSVMDGEMKERTRLARDLHDRLSGNLSAVKIEMNNMETLLNVSDKLDSCIEEVRRVAHNLMPASLQYGIKTALEDFAAQFSNVHFHFFGKDFRFEDRAEFVIYCCANELVNNSLKHSAAKSIHMQLVQDEKHVTLTVQDDGKGYDEKYIKKGIGLKNIYDRVTSCNGRVDIVSLPGKGTETTIELKIK